MAILFLVWLIVPCVLIAFQFRLKKWGAPTVGSLNTWSQQEASQSFLFTQHSSMQFALVVFFVTMWTLTLAALAYDGYAGFDSNGGTIIAGAFVYRESGQSPVSYSDFCGDSDLPSVYPADMSDYAYGSDFSDIQSAIQKIHKAECTIAAVASYLTWVQLMFVLFALCLVCYYAATTTRAWRTAHNNVLALHAATYPNPTARPPCVTPVLQVVSLQTLRWSTIACIFSFCSVLMYSTVTYVFLTHLTFGGIHVALWTSWRLDVCIFVFLVLTCWYQRVQIRHTLQPEYQPPNANPGSIRPLVTIAVASPAWMSQTPGGPTMPGQQAQAVMMAPVVQPVAGQNDASVSLPQQHPYAAPLHQAQAAPQYAMQPPPYQVQSSQTVMASPFGPQFQQPMVVQQPQQQQWVQMQPVYYAPPPPQQAVQNPIVQAAPAQEQSLPQQAAEHGVVVSPSAGLPQPSAPESPSPAERDSVTPAFCGHCGASFVGITMGVKFCPACGTKI